MKVLRLALAILSTAVLAACGSARDASKSNFEAAINKHFADDCTPLSFGFGQLTGVKGTDHGYPVIVRDTNYALQPNTAARTAFDALAKAGLLTSKPAQIPSSGQEPETGTAYALTEKGKQSLVKPGSVSFCVGHRRVDEVVQFSEPSDGLGQTMSAATYTYTVVDVPEWANDPAVRAAFPSLNQLLEPHQKAQATMVLMNDGWSM